MGPPSPSRPPSMSPSTTLNTNHPTHPGVVLSDARRNRIRLYLMGPLPIFSPVVESMNAVDVRGNSEFDTNARFQVENNSTRHGSSRDTWKFPRDLSICTVHVCRGPCAHGVTVVPMVHVRRMNLSFRTENAPSIDWESMAARVHW